MAVGESLGAMDAGDNIMIVTVLVSYEFVM